MITTLDEGLFRDTGDAEVCLFIANLAQWIKFNALKLNPEERNFHENQFWSYNSYTQFSKHFGAWTPKMIRTIIARALKLELIIISNFNKKRYDGTSWYTLTDKAWNYYPRIRDTILHTPAQMGTTPAQMGRPIPEELNTCSNNSITTTSEIVKAYHEELPECPKVKTVDPGFANQLKRMVKNWPSYQKDGKSFTIESFKDYLRLLKYSYPWILKPYTTQAGNIRKNSLRTITREVNISKIVNGEFSAST